MSYPLNLDLGWLLLLAGIAAAVGLDPWSLSERDPRVILGSTRMAARHAQAVALAMGFLQIAVALLLRGSPFRDSNTLQAGSVLLLVGTLVYAGGYGGSVFHARVLALVPVGAAINLAGFALLFWVTWQEPGTDVLCIVLAVFLFGMAIDVASGLLALVPKPTGRLDLGPEDDVRQRMLRLARVAATALSLVMLLFEDLWYRDPEAVEAWLGRRLIALGAVGMPVILTAASFLHRGIKYLLPVPALAMTAGTAGAFLLALREATLLEAWGWLLITASMGVGLLVGMYAFDGPLPTPRFVGAYNAFTRRLTRLGHAYCIAFGLLAVLLARWEVGPAAAWGVVVGTVVTLAAIALVALSRLPVRFLAAGPALLALTLLAALPARIRGPAVPKRFRDAAFSLVPSKGGTAFVRTENQP